MSEAFALNTDLSSAQWTPLVAIQLRLAGLGANLNNFQKRVLLLGHKTSAGNAQLNSVYQLVTQELANTRFGATSDVAALNAHTQAQLTGMSAGGAEIYGAAIAEPTGGVAATHLVRFLARPDNAGAPGVNTTASSSHACTIVVDGWPFPFEIAAGDTFASIATNGAAAITAQIAAALAPANCPIESAIASTDTITIKANHKGAIGADLPTSAEFSIETGGVAASPGAIVITGPATVAGTLTVTAGSLPVVTAVGSTDVVSTICANVTANLLAGETNVGGINNHANIAGQVVLTYISGHPAYRISAVAAATGVAVTASVGTAGSGVPSLTGILTALRKLKAFRVWVTPWTDTASLSAIETHRKEMSNGVIMKDQFILFGDTRDEVTAGAVPLAPSPTLTTTPWWGGICCPDAQIRGCELAAHVAGAIVGKDTPAYNWDYEPLLTSGPVPLLAPHPDSRLDPLTTANTVMVSYHLTPLIVDDDSNQFCILRGVTTAQVASEELSNWSVAFCLGYARAFAVNKILRRFIRDPNGAGGHLMLKKVGPPQSPNSVRADAVADCIKEILDDLEQGNDGSPPGVVDGADDLKALVRADYNRQSAGRIDGLFPIRVPTPLHKVSLVEQQVL